MNLLDGFKKLMGQAGAAAQTATQAMDPRKAVQAGLQAGQKVAPFAMGGAAGMAMKRMAPRQLPPQMQQMRQMQGVNFNPDPRDEVDYNQQGYSQVPTFLDLKNNEAGYGGGQMPAVGNVQNPYQLDQTNSPFTPAIGYGNGDPRALQLNIGEDAYQGGYEMPATNLGDNPFMRLMRKR